MRPRNRKLPSILSPVPGASSAPESDGVAHDSERGVLTDDTLVELILELEDLV